MSKPTNLILHLWILTVWIGLFLFGCGIQPGAILGEIHYDGIKTGEVTVTAQRVGKTGRFSVYNVSTGRKLGAYDMRLRRTGETYTVSAYMDINNNNKQDADEPTGFYDNNKDGIPDEVVVKGEVSNINITLIDP